MAASWARRRARPPAPRSGDCRPRIARGKRRARRARSARFARTLGVPHHVLIWRGAKPRSRIQERAREARYALLGECADAVGADLVVTAHHLDDQAETALFRLLRGSGIGGLRAMAARATREGVTIAAAAARLRQARTRRLLRSRGRRLRARSLQRRSALCAHAPARARRRASPPRASTRRPSPGLRAGPARVEDALTRQTEAAEAAPASHRDRRLRRGRCCSRSRPRSSSGCLTAAIADVGGGERAASAWKRSRRSRLALRARSQRAPLSAPTWRARTSVSAPRALCASSRSRRAARRPRARRNIPLRPEGRAGRATRALRPMDKGPRRDVSGLADLLPAVSPSPTPAPPRRANAGALLFGRRDGRQLEHERVLAGRQVGQHDQPPVGKLQRVMMDVRLIEVHLAECRDARGDFPAVGREADGIAAKNLADRTPIPCPGRTQTATSGLPIAENPRVAEWGNSVVTKRSPTLAGMEATCCKL